MALKLTVESFLQVVRQSGLIDKDQLQKLLQQYESRGMDVKKSQAIADALVADDLITRWQAEKLLAGKHKGFSLGKYKLLDLLGKGGMSSVYLAEHVLMKRRCAIKVLPAKRVNDTSYLARFHREAQAVASVDHPNIVRAYDVDFAQDRDSQIHFLVMEYVNGQSLQELIVRSGPAEFADAVEYIRQAAEGLEHAHRAGLVHRDIKPGNLLIDSSGTIKILDMGLARFFDDREENPLTVAHDEKVLGTADYLAPEQALDSHSVDTRADLYSLGCTLYFFLTGHPPFTEGTLTQRLMWHQTKQFPPLSESRLDCPSSLQALLDKMVEKKPEDRYQSAADVAAACRQWLADNAGAEWQQRHVPLKRSGTDLRMPPPSRDLQSDSATMAKTGSHVMESAVSPGDSSDSSVTKISRPGASQAVPTTAPLTTPLAASPTAIPAPSPASAPSPPPVAAPPIAAPVVAVPVVAAPVVAMPVAPPVAQPISAPAPPVARPVVPVAMPIAAPVVAPVVAQPVATVAPPVPVIVPATSPVPEPTPPSDEVPGFFFASDSAAEPTETVLTEPAQEPEAEGDLFSLFAGADDATNVEPTPEPTIAEPVTVSQPEPASEPEPEPTTPDFDFAAVPTSDQTPHAAETAETILFDQTPAAIEQPPAEEAPFDFADTPVTPAEAVPTEIPATQPTAMPMKATSGSNLLAKFGKSNKTVLYGAVAAAVIVVVGGVAWWSTGGASDDGKAAGKSNKKATKSTTGGTAAKPADAYEVTLHVGAGGEFKSIGRAVHSAIEGRAEHEAAAKGKPLRFVISVKPGAPFEESLVLDDSLPGEVHLLSETSGKNFTLKAPGDEPVIVIKNLKGVTIENVTIDLFGFPPRETGIVVSGSVDRCRIRNSVISGAGKAGIELNGASGGEGTGSITIDSVTFHNAAPTAFGVYVAKPANGPPTQRVTVQRCRFISSMSAGVFIEGPVDSLAIRNCGASGTANGVRFAAGVVAKNVLVDHCSFRNQAEAGLLFDAMPGVGSGDLSWRNCLFAGVKKAELLIAKEYDAAKFNALLSTDKPAENNWSDRKPDKQVSGEHDVLGKGGSRVEEIQFASTSPTNELFLVAKPAAPYKAAGIRAK